MVYNNRATNPAAAARPIGAAVWKAAPSESVLVAWPLSVLLAGSVMVALVTSVEPPVVMVDSVIKVVGVAVPLSVGDPESVPEPVEAPEVE